MRLFRRFSPFFDKKRPKRAGKCLKTTKTLHNSLFCGHYPDMSEIHAFDEQAGIDLSHHVEAILAAHAELTYEQAEALWIALSERFADETVEYGADFDLTQEVEAQIRAVRAMRESVITKEGKVKSGVGARDLKEVVTASNTLLQTLMKTHEKVLNYDRQRALEEATVAAVETLGDEEKTRFFTVLEARLESIK